MDKGMRLAVYYGPRYTAKTEPIIIYPYTFSTPLSFYSLKETGKITFYYRPSKLYLFLLLKQTPYIKTTPIFGHIRPRGRKRERSIDLDRQGQQQLLL
jgi:hypothetical protein